MGSLEGQQGKHAGSLGGFLQPQVWESRPRGREGDALPPLSPEQSNRLLAGRRGRQPWARLLHAAAEMVSSSLLTSFNRCPNRQNQESQGQLPRALGSREKLCVPSLFSSWDARRIHLGRLSKFSCPGLHPRPSKSDSLEVFPVCSIFKKSASDSNMRPGAHNSCGSRRPPSSGLGPRCGPWGAPCPGFVTLSLASLVAATTKIEPMKQINTACFTGQDRLF